jgi:WD40 repeat protein
MWRWDFSQSDPRRGLAGVPGEPKGVYALAVSRDGKRLAASDGPDIHLWTLSGRDLRRAGTVKGQGGTLRAVAFSPDGKRLACAGENGRITVWESGWLRNTLVAAMAGHAEPVAVLSYAPDGKVLASAGHDGSIRLWDADADAVEPKTVFGGHHGKVRLIQYLPVGGKLLAVTDRGQIILWDVATGARASEWSMEKLLAASLAVSPDGRRLAIGDSAGHVNLFHLESARAPGLVPTAFNA